jgi:hypothetical protein
MASERPIKDMRASQIAYERDVTFESGSFAAKKLPGLGLWVAPVLALSLGQAASITLARQRTTSMSHNYRQRTGPLRISTRPIAKDLRHSRKS